MLNIFRRMFMPAQSADRRGQKADDAGCPCGLDTDETAGARRPRDTGDVLQKAVDRQAERAQKLPSASVAKNGKPRPS